MRCTERIRDLYVTIHIFMNLERAILRLNRSVREIKRLRYDALKCSRKKKGGQRGTNCRMFSIDRTIDFGDNLNGRSIFLFPFFNY